MTILQSINRVNREVRAPRLLYLRLGEPRRTSGPVWSGPPRPESRGRLLWKAAVESSSRSRLGEGPSPSSLSRGGSEGGASCEGPGFWQHGQVQVGARPSQPSEPEMPLGPARPRASPLGTPVENGVSPGIMRPCPWQAMSQHCTK